ncbi:fasciclin domain-containing protein [Mucilaginibacter agri]|uniref:Fasciclin domain-containing protein n=1 Tax=Mucilaginibacter agri TaxID=2695265 RepID=A0A966DX68_9SPHI|nr:fasciclin domain-containing protein [Mucilaginibacter agri]NCD72009.1 fasciclin domain-containing protein [Mucilaginibacter agri]
MRRVLLLITIVFISIGVYAQKVAMPSTPVTDSVRVKINKSKKVTEVDGVDMYASKDIVQNLTNAPRFSIVLNAIRKAGLIGTFKSKGPITMFVPTNEAFKKLPEGRLDTLLKINHNLDLCQLLAYHAIVGKVNSKKISKEIRAGKGKAIFTTLAGSKLIATEDDKDNIVLTDEFGNNSLIQVDDIEESNGIIHVINGVLVPKRRSI